MERRQNEELLEARRLRRQEQKRRLLMRQRVLVIAVLGQGVLVQGVGQRMAGRVDNQFGVARSDARILLPPRIHARQQAESRWRTRSRGRIGIGEALSLGGQPVDVGRRDLRGAVAAQVADAQVVGIDEDDVGARRGRNGLLPAAGQQRRRRQGGQKERCFHNYRFFMVLFKTETTSGTFPERSSVRPGLDRLERNQRAARDGTRKGSAWPPPERVQRGPPPKGVNVRPGAPR